MKHGSGNKKQEILKQRLHRSKSGTTAPSLMKPFFITTAIDYVNAKPHVGHATEKILTDVVARHHRLSNPSVFFLTGSDENGLKNVRAAEKAGQLAPEFVAENADAFKDLKGQLNLSFDAFIRTTEDRHFLGAQKLWTMFQKEDLEVKDYHGLYCVGCEEFKMEKDLVDGKCPEHLKEPEVIEEKNWFFKLSNYKSLLSEKILKNEVIILPDYRRNEMLAFIDNLEDFSISRSKDRAANWGVPVPGDDAQVMYVWVDALSNYITALDFATDGELYKKYWESNGERVHVIGKGILRFHAIYWIAMLLSAKLPLPTKIYAHEYLTVNGQKMSKSLGNVIGVDELTDRFGVDGTRYLLLAALPYSKDGDISWEKMTEKYNADLANGLGNLTSRLIKLSEKLDTDNSQQITVNGEYPGELKKLMDEYRITEALEWIIARTRVLDKKIAEVKPWELVKTDMIAFEKEMLGFLGELSFIASCLRPFLPETSEKIAQAIESRKTEPLFQRV